MLPKNLRSINRPLPNDAELHKKYLERIALLFRHEITAVYEKIKLQLKDCVGDRALSSRFQSAPESCAFSLSLNRTASLRLSTPEG